MHVTLLASLCTTGAGSISSFVDEVMGLQARRCTPCMIDFACVTIKLMLVRTAANAAGLALHLAAPTDTIR